LLGSNLELAKQKVLIKEDFMPELVKLEEQVTEDFVEK